MFLSDPIFFVFFFICNLTDFNYVCDCPLSFDSYQMNLLRIALHFHQFLQSEYYSGCY